ncbi:hypothetical protein TTHERM_00459300 (macronuclear) [Tetrahymena thermophila SB210]|uniref:Uncharacterized protein n=1 Tax=Tetrahymena thermophila (strain SB210) TaxID=312017 RepID=I7MAA1_TETTS|nr:hypothetical protein TTHERM_00459300 [Tetrahymena thermophila SB210]EAS03993.2 hypothetical protein TTHERM_00459300 [Tetrahymena thermophila SB210]|eukprot:XP_001024238.2 hypothetical protein TTHERM_00459300 [Tetrahymena thermophila SB210]
MNKGILSEVQINRQQSVPNKSSKLLKNNSYQKQNAFKQVSKQNLILNCHDDEGIDLTRLDSNTCIDQGNGSKYDNCLGEIQVQESLDHNFHRFLKQNNTNVFRNNQNECSFQNSSNNFIISQRNKDDNNNINKTFSVMDSVYDEQQIAPRSVNRETVDQIMKIMPKSAQNILQKIMGRNSEDGSKVTLNPSQNEDFFDEQSVNTSSFNSLLLSSSKKVYESNTCIETSQCKSNSSFKQPKQLLKAQQSSNNFRNKDQQKENQPQTTYLKILQGQYQDVSKHKQGSGVFQRAKDITAMQDNQINQQLSSEKYIQKQKFQQNQQQINKQNVNQLQMNDKQFNNQTYSNLSFIDKDLGDFSFELENVQNKPNQKNINSNTSNIQRQQQPKRNNNFSISKNNQNNQIDQLEGLQIGYNTQREEKYIQTQANKYQSTKQNDPKKYFTQRSISPVSNVQNKVVTNKNMLNEDKKRNQKNNSMEKINKNKNIQNQYSTQNELTFSQDRGLNIQTSCQLSQENQVILQQILSRNQKNILEEIEQRPSSNFFDRSISPQQKRPLSLGTTKKQTSKKVLERSTSSMSQQNYKSNDKSTSSLKEGGNQLSSINKKNVNISLSQNNNFSSNRVQNYINRIKNSNSSPSVSTQNKAQRSKTSQIALGDKQQTPLSYSSTRSNQKSKKQINSGSATNGAEKNKTLELKSQKNINSNLKNRSSLNMDKIENFCQTSQQRISPTFTSLSVTSNSKKNIKSPQKASLFSNLDKILRAGRSKSSSLEKQIYDKNKLISKPKDVQKRSNSKEKVKSIVNLNKNGSSEVMDKLNNLLEKGRVQTFFSEGNSQNTTQNQVKQQSFFFQNNNQQQHNQFKNNQYEQRQQQVTDQQVQIEAFKQNVQQNNQTSLKNQVEQIVRQISQQHQPTSNQLTRHIEPNISQDINDQYSNTQKSFSIIQNENKVFNNDEKKLQFNRESFFEESPLPGQEKSYQESPLNLSKYNEQSKGGFQSHISSICLESQMSLENLEPRVVDSKTVNEIMRAMPSSAQQILQKIMSRGNQNPTQILINPSQSGNTSLPLNFSFDIEQEDAQNFNKSDASLKKMASSIIPQQDSKSIRYEEEDDINKQSNSTDIEQIVKQLNFENNCSSFASSSNDQKGRSNRSSKTFSSNTKEKLQQCLISSNIPKNSDFNMTEDDLKLETRFQSLDKMINLNDNLNQKEKTKNVEASKTKSKLNYSYSQQNRNQKHFPIQNLQYQNQKQQESDKQQSHSKQNYYQDLGNSGDFQEKNLKLEESLSHLTPQQIQVLEELSKQQLLEICKKQLNQSQQSIKSDTQKQLNLSKSQNRGQELQSQVFSKQKQIASPSQTKQIQSKTKNYNIDGINTSMCNLSQQSFESFSSSSIKPHLQKNQNNISSSKKSINYYSNQRNRNKQASNKTLEKLNHSNQSTEHSTQILQHTSFAKNRVGSKCVTEESIVDRSYIILQTSMSNQGQSQAGQQFMTFKPQTSFLPKNISNNNSDRIKKLNQTLSNLTSQLSSNNQQSEQRVHSVPNRNEDQYYKAQTLSSCRNESPQVAYNSYSCTSLSAVPNISENSVLNRSLRELQSGILLDHQKEVYAEGLEYSHRSLSSAHDKAYPQASEHNMRMNRSNTCEMKPLQSNYIPKQFEQKKQLEELQLTVNEKEAEIISLKLQVQDLQEVLEKQKFLQSSQKNKQKKLYNEIEEKIISSRINIDCKVFQNQVGSTKSISSMKTTSPENKNEYSEQKFCETYPKNIAYMSSSKKNENDQIQQQNSVKRLKIQASSAKKETILSSNLDDTENSHLKLNASEIDLTYQINQFSILKNQNDSEYQPNQNLQC